MGYEILTVESLQTYISRIPTLTSLIGENSFKIREVGDGNLNYVYVVEGSQNSLIVKQAVPYFRKAGESWKLSKNRMLFEIAALKKFSDLVPDHIPTIYHADQEMCLVAMRYLNTHLILRKGMIASTYYPNLAEHLSSFLANTLFKTSSYFLTSKEKRELESQFNANHDLCKLSEDLLFTFPYMPHDTNPQFPGMESVANELHSDADFKRQVLSLKYRFMNHKDALLHGDFHTGSIMVNEQDTYIIDPEFAFYGPFGFDVGALIANILLSYASHTICDTDKNYSHWLIETLIDFLNKFQIKFLNLLTEQKDNSLIIPGYLSKEDLYIYHKEILLKIVQDSFGFAGCKMTRRIFGIAGVADIREIEDHNLRLASEKLAIRIAKTLVKNHSKVTNSTDFIKRILSE
jgi:5-methylthioribose kinase